MSICVAWRYEQKLCLASDSRISGYGHVHSDIGIKILEVPIRVISAFNQPENQFDLVFTSVAGLGFSGSFLTAYLVKERIADTLFHLQYLGAPERLNFKRIADISFKAYRHAIEELHQGDGFGHDTDFFLMGFCPETKQPRAFKFFRHLETGKLMQAEILTEKFSYDVIGAGEMRFRDRIEAKLNMGNRRVHFDVFAALKEVIESGEVVSVGGAIQYGEIEGNTAFQVFGVQDYTVEGRRFIPKMFCRGVDSSEVNAGGAATDLHIHYEFMAPFRDLIIRRLANPENE